jgi:uncharacterized membrane protein YeaQ/YmgE (transglycosylase-associated protein family)
MWSQTLLLWIFVGIVTGWFSSTLIGRGYGAAVDILVAILGSLLGGLSFYMRAPIAYPAASLGVAFVGSAGLLLMLRCFHHTQHQRRISR